MGAMGAQACFTNGEESNPTGVELLFFDFPEPHFIPDLCQWRECSPEADTVAKISIQCIRPQTLGYIPYKMSLDSLDLKLFRYLLYGIHRRRPGAEFGGTEKNLADQDF